MPCRPQPVASPGAQRSRPPRRRASASSARISSRLARCRPPGSALEHLPRPMRGDVEEADPAGEERADRDLVGGVQHGRRAAARAQRLARQAQRREARRHPAPRRSAADLAEVERGGRRRDALRPAQRVGDRRAHVGLAELGQHRAVADRRPGCARSTADGPGPRSAPRGRPNRWCASISSRPLFIMVAESTEILAPMLQFGWATACSGVIAAISASERSAERPARGGQDQAARPLSALLAVEHLEDRVVLGIDRQQHGAAARDLGHQQRAGADQASPCWRAPTIAPRRTAASVGARPAAPTIAAITQSAGRAAASTTRLAARRRPRCRCRPERSLAGRR